MAFSFAALSHKERITSGLTNAIADVARICASAILLMYSSGSVVRYLPSLFLDTLTGFSHRTMLSLASPVPLEGTTT